MRMVLMALPLTLAASSPLPVMASLCQVALSHVAGSQVTASMRPAERLMYFASKARKLFS